MNHLIPLAVVVVALVGLASVLPSVLKQLGRDKRRPTRLPYRKKDWLLTAAERSFFEVLCASVDNNIVVFAKVRLFDLVYLAKGTESRQGYTNRVMSKHVDFVLCDRQRVAPLLVVELDDSSHERSDRQERDAFVDEVLNTAGLPVLHVPAQRAYVRQQVAQQIQQRIVPAPAQASP